MIQWIQAPNNEHVSQYIESYWFIHRTADAAKEQPFPKLNPDPYPHFIISPNKQRYLYHSHRGKYTGSGSHWLFPHSQTYQMDHSSALVMIGIKFKLTALHDLGFHAISSLIDSVSETSVSDIFLKANITVENDHGARLESLLPTSIDLAIEQNESYYINTLDNVLSALLPKRPIDKHSDLVKAVLNRCLQRPLSPRWVSNFIFHSEQ